MTPASGEPRHASILPIFLIVIVDVFGMTLVLPLLPFYAEHHGASVFQATLLVTIYAACQLISSPQIGHISDHIGRKPMLLLSQIGTFIGFIMLARAQALWVIFLSRAIDGATAGNLSIAQAYIADNTDAKDRTKSFALIGIAFGLGFFIGPMLSGILAKSYGITVPIYLAAGMSATSILCTALLLPGGKPQHGPEPAGATGDVGPAGRRMTILNWGVYVKYFRRPVLSERLWQFFCLILSFSMFMSGFALFAERRFTWNSHPWTAHEVGILFGYVGFLGIILQGGLMKRLVARFGEGPLVISGFVALAAAYFGLGISYGIGALVIMATVSAYGHGILRPTLSSLITQQVGRREHGVILGLTTSLQSVAQVIGPMIAGALIGHGQLVLWAWAAAAMGGLGLILALIMPAALPEESQAQA